MKRLVVLAVVVGAALVVALAVIGVRTIQRFDEHWSDPGNQTRFITPQAMSRGVGLVELHRLRHGRYPASLSDLRFLSGFDRAMLVWLEYASSEDGDAYYLAVDRDRPGAEGVTWPSGYWDGTGYDPALASGSGSRSPERRPFCCQRSTGWGRATGRRSSSAGRPRDLRARGGRSRRHSGCVEFPSAA
jgi:hypothetical protein